MKKFFPIVLIFAFFVASITLREIFLLSDSSAMHINRRVEVKGFYQRLFKTAKLEYPSNIVELSKINKPVVVILFWASWCTPCIKEFPGLVRTISKYRDVIEVLGINTDDDDTLSDVKKIQKQYKHNFNSILDQEGQLIEKFHVATVPFTLIYINGKLSTISDEAFYFESPKFIDSLENLKKNEIKH
jgi:thiol-disulfide isomerase/thioredoxin